MMRLIVVFAFVLVAPLSVWAQELSQVTPLPFSEAEVTLAPFDAAASPSVAKAAASNPALARLIPYAAILTNSSTKNIMVLTIRWRPEGTPPEQGAETVQDGLYLVHKPVLAPGAKMLVTPRYNWPESLIGNTLIGIGAEALLSAAERLESGPPLTAEVDTVIFDDGLILGPDHSNTVREMIARKEAAELVSKATLAALEHGDDATAILNELSSQRVTAADIAGRWQVMISRLLLRLPQRKKLAEQLFAIPSVANFHRNQQ